MTTTTRSRTQTPQIIELPRQTMAVVHTTGDPATPGAAALPALYGAIYCLRAALKRQGVAFSVGPLRARWPDAHLLPREQWSATWALPVPDGTTAAALPQQDPQTPVTVEEWEYGTVAQILHLGPYATEGPSIERLHAFIARGGYAMCGPHEEVYLTRPIAKQPKTLICSQVRRAD
jgi:hypothetical protein